MGDAPTGAATRFRGWWVLAFCTLAITLTTPGQTIGVSAFVDEIVDALDLSDTSVSGAYLVGTLLGSTAMASIGRWIDRRGVARTMLIISMSFSAVVMAMSTVQNLVMLTLGFVGIRMLGQGSLSLVSQTSIALWFERRRGVAFGIAMTVSAGLMACGPFLLTRLIDAVGWRAAWVVAGGVVFVALVPITALWMVDRPESIGQSPDGEPAPSEIGVGASAHYTARAAMRTGAFWTLTFTMVVASALITGLTFHHFAMMEDRGLSEDAAAAVFLPQMVGTVAMGFVFAWLTDVVRARVLLAVSMGFLAVGLLAYQWVEPGWTAAVFGALIGLNAGAIRALGSTLYPKWFGTQHIGAIRGISTQFGVAASAIGPLIVAVGSGWAGSYARLLVGLTVVPLIAALCAVLVPEPTRSPGGLQPVARTADE